MSRLAPVLAKWLGEGAVIAEVVRTEGSTPREAGAVMLVSRDAIHGSIGGGQLEFHVMEVARTMLAAGEAIRVLDLPLGPHMGQCCGGRAHVRLERAGEPHMARLAALDSRQEEARPTVAIFGAGHTGRALAQALGLLPFAVSLVDDRDGVHDGLPPHILALRPDDPAAALASLPPGAACVVMTHSHALDYRLTDAALKRGDLSYVGLIGSATKRAGFISGFRRGGGSERQLAGLTCPIGGAGVRDKRPEVIAAMVAAELIARLLPGSREPETG